MTQTLSTNMYSILQVDIKYMSKPTGNSVDCSERSKNSHCPDGAQVQFLHVEAVFQGTEK